MTVTSEAVELGMVLRPEKVVAMAHVVNAFPKIAVNKKLMLASSKKIIKVAVPVALM